MKPPDYQAWLDLLELKPDSLAVKVCADYQCGPNGGILPYLTGMAAAYPLHTRAAAKNKSKHRGLWHYPIRRNWTTPLFDGQADVTFCLEALGRVRAGWTIATELSRITRVGGRLYVASVLRGVDRVGVTERRLSDILAPLPKVKHRSKYPIRWRWLWYSVGSDLPHRNPQHALLVGCLQRIRE